MRRTVKTEQDRAAERFEYVRAHAKVTFAGPETIWEFSTGALTDELDLADAIDRTIATTSGG